MPYISLPAVVDGAVVQASWGNQVKANFDASPNGLATTPGQLFYATAAGTLAPLAPGSTGQILTISGGVPVWAPPTNYAVRAHRTTTLSIGTAATAIGFDADDWDTAALHDPSSSNNRFVAPIAGVYDFFCSVALSYGAGNTNGLLMCRSSGAASLARQDLVPNATNSFGYGTVAGQVKLAAGDWIEFAALVNGSGTATLQAEAANAPAKAGMAWIAVG